VPDIDTSWPSQSRRKFRCAAANVDGRPDTASCRLARIEEPGARRQRRLRTIATARTEVGALGAARMISLRLTTPRGAVRAPADGGATGSVRSL
jgi:hypothetical protein